MLMLSRARVKFIKSLQVKKYRQEEQRFVVEGVKSVVELVRSSFHVDLLIATAEIMVRYRSLFEQAAIECVEVKAADLASLGTFKTNDSVLAVARMKPNLPFNVADDEFVLVLDDIRDPGNLGTILRIADWYGIQKIAVSKETADLYNPKTLQASMGSFTRVQVYYTDLPLFLEQASIPVVGALMEGENVHGVEWGPGALVVIGNEAHGISKEVGERITRRITIPRFGKAESLNAAVATAIICDNIRR